MQADRSSQSNSARTARTRAALIAAARALFVEHGFAATGTPDLVKAAGVTRGALYHHFEDKRALFCAVVEAESMAVADAIDAGADEAGPIIRQLKAGARAYFDAMRTPGRVRLLLIEAPVALGPHDANRIDAMAAGRTLEDGLRQAIDQGAMRSLPLAALSAVLNAAFDRCALDIERGMARRQAEIVIDAIIDGLRRTPARGKA